MMIYIFQCCSLISSHPRLLPQSPKVCSLHLCLFCCLAYRVIVAAAKSLESCLTLCDPIDGSPPGSSIPGILQARMLEWVAIAFSNACMQSRFRLVRPCATPWTAARHWRFSWTHVSCFLSYHQQDHWESQRHQINQQTEMRWQKL